MKFMIGGDFSMVNSIPMPYLVKWNGTTWTHVGGGNIDGNILRLKVINGELIAMGTFSQIGGISAIGIAKFNGTTWTDLFNFPAFLNGSGYVVDACIYNGDWYVGGNFQTSTDTTSDLVVYKNSSWEKVGTNDFLKGSFTGVSAVEVYHNELFVCGLINKDDGNIGHGIQRWNGTNWNSVGTGFKNQSFTTTGNMSAWDMIVYKDSLYVTGGFYFAGDIPMRGIAIWNGDKWCGNSSTLIPNIAESILILNDTIYLSSNDTIDGNYMNKLAFWPNENYIDSCSVPMSIDEWSEESSILVYPNPVNDLINFKYDGTTNERFTISVFDITGKLITIINEKEFSNGQTQSVPVASLSSGIYCINITSELTSQSFKFIKN